MAVRNTRTCTRYYRGKKKVACNNASAEMLGITLMALGYIILAGYFISHIPSLDEQRPQTQYIGEP